MVGVVGSSPIVPTNIFQFKTHLTPNSAHLQALTMLSYDRCTPLLDAVRPPGLKLPPRTPAFLNRDLCGWLLGGSSDFHLQIRLADKYNRKQF